MGVYLKIKKLLEKWGLIEKSEFDHIRTSDYPHVHFAKWTGLPYTTKKEILEGPEGEEVRKKMERFSELLRAHKAKGESMSLSIDG